MCVYVCVCVHVCVCVCVCVCFFFDTVVLCTLCVQMCTSDVSQ